jgi:SAM-dependent methyltransferase
VELLLNVHAGLEPSPWVRRWAPLIRRGGTVLDVACGSGRHLRWLHAQGFAVTGVDRDAAAVEPLRTLGRIIVADIESAPWPLAIEPASMNLNQSVRAEVSKPCASPSIPQGERIQVQACQLNHETFDAVIVTNYLWRPLLATIVASVAPGGVLIYETFAAGNEAFGKPSNPNFLLHSGELLWACATLQVVAYEDGLLDNPLRRVQRIAARRQAADAAPLEFGG